VLQRGTAIARRVLVTSSGLLLHPGSRLVPIGFVRNTTSFGPFETDDPSPRAISSGEQRIE
jgi:hypothetical protein